MQFKKGSGWKACYNEETGRYFGEYGGIQSYHLYELTKDMFDRLVWSDNVVFLTGDSYNNI